MLILTIRTDKPEAEIGLFEDESRLAYTAWMAHRELAETIQGKMESMLKSRDKKISDLNAIAAFKGPGSFTGLRIGLTVANAMAYGLNIPIVATEGDDWLKNAIIILLKGGNEKIITPEYGSPPNITQPKK
jgi:tRNA threonylcarbamoyladenosine biosynthesis protein TsaB